MQLTPAIAAAATALLTGFVPKPVAPSIGLTPPGRTHTIFFADTDRELHVYHIQGRVSGPTLLIIGGIHGNEPGGYLAADLYADLTLRRGNLIIVPRANIYSIYQNTRGAHGDLNRQFGAYQEHEVDQDIVAVLASLMTESDALLNLHDGSGFYSPVWEGPRRNPQLWGQSIIVDTEEFSRPGGQRVDLQATAMAVVERVNREIKRPDHCFRVKNTMTFNEESPHKEQRGSATFHAVSRVGIPGFGIETSQDISDESLRVEYQVLVINAFLERFGIEPDHPRFALETPALSYLAVSVDGEPSIIVEDGGTLAVAPGSKVEITHVEANYERGLVVDIEGVGGFNNFHHSIMLEKDTRVYVRKDKYPCGSILLRADTAASVGTSPPVSASVRPQIRIDAFRLAINGRWTYLVPGESLKVLWGDELVLDDPLASTVEGYKVNFRGFVGNPTVNDGEDRGYTIHTAHDLLQRFSLSSEEERYEIRAERGLEIFAKAVVEIEQPRLEYVLVRLGYRPPLALAEGDTLGVSPSEELAVVDVVTIPRASEPLTVNFRGFAGPEGPEDRGYTIRLGRDLLPAYSLRGEGRLYEITVRRKGLLIGRIVVALQPRADGEW